jgi:hypothetical protein
MQAEIAPDDLVLMAHRLCRPYAITKDGEKNVRFPRAFAVMYVGCTHIRHVQQGVARVPFEESAAIASASRA